MFHENAMGAGRHRWSEMSAGKRALMICGGAAAFAAVLAASSLAVMLIWNRVMSGILGLAALGFWDAFWLLILAKILLGGRGHPFFARMRMRRAMRERMARKAEDGEENQD